MVIASLTQLSCMVLQSIELLIHVTSCSDSNFAAKTAFVHNAVPFIYPCKNKQYGDNVCELC